MSGEELNRKYWELCGLEEIENIGGHWMYLDKSLALTAGGRWHSRLPRLDLDANLAIAEADRVFVEWIYTSVPENGRRRVNAYWQRNPETGFYRSLEVHGDTFCDAILNALIAAKEPQQ